MSRLRLALLGTLEVRHGEQVVRFPTRKAAALLIYLAVEGGRHSREKIAALLWPDSDAERARGTLRSTLGLLRAALPEGPDDARPHLIAERETLAVALTADDDLDLNALQSAFSQARQSTHLPPGEAIARLRAATRAYRGDFLDGFSLGDASAFDEWASVQREAWHRRVGQVYDRLSQELSDGGELTQATEETARWIAREPLNESAHRRLMRLHVASRDRAGALRAYDACRSILDRELNAEPSPETTALGERIRAEPLPRRERRRRELVVPAATEIPLVGRLSEHTELVGAYRTVRRGRTVAVSIEGEAGIGKTRLANAFLGWAAAQGASVLQGRAFESGSGVSYHPIVEALRGWLAEVEDPRRVLADVWLAELARLLPELRERYPDLPAPPSVGESEARTRLYDGIVRVGQALVKRGPVVLFVDDLQWVDAATREVLHYAARRWAAGSSPILLVFTGRSEELSTTPTLVEWRNALGRDVPLTRVELGPLTREDIARLAEGLGVTDASFVEWLFAESGGQPFFVVEIVKALTERGIFHSRQGGGWVADSSLASTGLAQLRGLLPPGIQEVIRARIARLSPFAHGVLAAASALGGGFEFEPLRLVAGIGENEGLTALDELLARRLLHENDAEYVFGHDKIREVAYGDAGEARRRTYHRRALDVLEARKAPSAELARHAQAAGLAERATQLSFAAVDEAMRVFAVRDAIEHYERGMRMSEQPTPSPQVLSQVGRAYEITTQYAQARATYERILALARQLPDPKLECAALNRLATVATLDGGLDRETPAALLQQALAVAEANGDVEGLVDTEWNLSRLSLFRFDLAATHDHGTRALTRARELAAKEPIARSLNWLALVEVHLGQWVTAREHAEEARDLYQALGNRAMEADSLVQLAAAQIRFGQPEAGIAAARQARTMSREMENSWGEADADRELALGLLERGQYGEALAIARASVTAARVAGYIPLLVICLGVHGSVCRRVGLLEEARASHGEEMAIADGSSYPPFVEAAAAELCADSAVGGDWSEAVTYARRALDARTGSASFVGFTRWYETEAVVRAGDVDRALDDAHRFGETVGASPRYRIPYLRCLAVLASARGDLPAAAVHLGQARDLAEEIGLPGELWSIEVALAELARGRGDEPSARLRIVRATEIVESLAATIPDETVRAAFVAQCRQSLER